MCLFIYLIMIPNLQTIEDYVNEVYDDGIVLNTKSRQHLVVRKKALFSVIAKKFYHHSEITKYSGIPRLDIIYYCGDKFKLGYEKRFLNNIELITKKLISFDNNYYLSMGTI